MSLGGLLCSVGRSGTETLREEAGEPGAGERVKPGSEYNIWEKNKNFTLLLNNGMIILLGNLRNLNEKCVDIIDS